jgi:hypothetical protein
MTPTIDEVVRRRLGGGWLNAFGWAFVLLNPITMPTAVVMLVTGRE